MKFVSTLLLASILLPNEVTTFTISKPTRSTGALMAYRQAYQYQLDVMTGHAPPVKKSNPWGQQPQQPPAAPAAPPAPPAASSNPWGQQPQQPPAAPAAPAAPSSPWGQPQQQQQQQQPPPAPAAPSNPWGAPAPAAPAVEPANHKPMSDKQAQEMGWSMGGESHTRDPRSQVNSDPRKTIPQGESFEEYMKARR